MLRCTVSPLQELQAHHDRVWCVACAPSGSHLATCSGDKTVVVWARQQGSGSWYPQATLEETHNRTIRACSWSPDSRSLATCSFDATTAIWEVQAGVWEHVATLEGHENEVKCVAWSPCGTLIATCGRDKSVWIWESLPGHEYACVDVKHGHTQDVKMVAWHPLGDLLASCSYDNSIKLWVSDGDEWLCAQTLSEGTGHTSTVWCLAFEPSGGRMVSCGADATIKLWSCGMSGQQPAFRHLATLSGLAERPIYTVDWSKDGLIAAGDGENAVRIFAEQGEALRKEGGAGGASASFMQVACVEGAHAADVNCVRWHPTETGLLLSAGDDAAVKAWRVVQEQQ